MLPDPNKYGKSLASIFVLDDRSFAGSIHALSGNDNPLQAVPNYRGMQKASNAFFNTLSPSKTYARNGAIDTEPKLLGFVMAHTNSNSRGWINMYTVNNPCRSCGGDPFNPSLNNFHPSGIIGQFKDARPFIDLHVYWTAWKGMGGS